MDWTGVADLLRRGAKEYRLYQDAIEAADRMVAVEREAAAMVTSLKEVTAQRDAVVEEANKRAAEWNRKEAELRASFEDQRRTLDAELAALRIEVQTERNELLRAQGAHNAAVVAFAETQKGQARAMAQAEADHAAQIAKAKNTLEGLRKSVADALKVAE